jgi:hypothetical protein
VLVPASVLLLLLVTVYRRRNGNRQRYATALFSLRRRRFGDRYAVKGKRYESPSGPATLGTTAKATNLADALARTNLSAGSWLPHGTVDIGLKAVDAPTPATPPSITATNAGHSQREAS